MDTAYKTRAWWMIRALSYAESIVFNEDTKRHVVSLCVNVPSQTQILAVEMKKSALASCAPQGSECLTRTYVDRQGNLLPQFVRQRLI